MNFCCARPVVYFLVMSSKIDTFRALVMKDPKNALARYGLANELIKEERYEEARSVLLEYLSMHDDEGAAYRLLAAVHEKLGRVEEACEAYRRGVDAARRHGHPSMAAEFQAKLEELEDE